MNGKAPGFPQQHVVINVLRYECTYRPAVYKTTETIPDILPAVDGALYCRVLIVFLLFPHSFR